MSQAYLQIAKLTDPEAVNVRQFGGKISSLAQLTAEGVRVPAGLAVGKQVLEFFLSTNGIDLTALEHTHNRGMIFLESALNEAQAWLERIVATIRDGAIPLEVKHAILDGLPSPGGQYAVRSSCVVEDASLASFAGQYVTILSVSGWDDILGALRACWSSQYGSQALAYAIARRGMPVLVPSMAVLVQEMLQPEYAGVCFTEGPTPATRGLAVVESVAGVGESLVSGSRTPAHFEIAADGSIKRAHGALVSEAPTREQVAFVAAECRRIAAFHGSPQDVEWAIVANQLHILQARPITTVDFPRTELSSIVSGSRVGKPPKGMGTDALPTVLRDDLHEWLLTRLDPLLYRGAAYLLGQQQEDGSWRVEGNPEWDCVATALMVRLFLDGGIPGMLAWPSFRGEETFLGVRAAVGWLVQNVGGEGIWGTDLWDSCQVIRTLLRSGVALDEPIVAKALEAVVDQLDRGIGSIEQEWAGAGFFAVAIHLFFEAGREELLNKWTSLLLDGQTDAGDFSAFPHSGEEGVPSEWHTAQAITALSQCRSTDEMARAAVERATTWLISRQQRDGSWGVTAGPYSNYNTFFTGYSVIALHSAGHRGEALAKALRWLRGKQVASGGFGDIASSLMTMTAFQNTRGPIFSLDLPIPLFLRIQTCLGALSQAAKPGKRWLR